MKRILQRLLSLFRSNKKPDDHLFVNRPHNPVEQIMNQIIKKEESKQMGGFIDTEYELRKQAMRNDSISIGDVIDET